MSLERLREESTEDPRSKSAKCKILPGVEVRGWNGTFSFRNSSIYHCSLAFRGAWSQPSRKDTANSVEVGSDLRKYVTLLRETYADYVNLDLKPKACGWTMDDIHQIRLRTENLGYGIHTFFHPRISMLPSFFQEPLPVLHRLSSYPIFPCLPW